MIDSRDCRHHCLLVEECGVICRWWPRPSTAPSWCHGEAGVMRPVNSCQTCSGARNIGFSRIQK